MPISVETGSRSPEVNTWTGKDDLASEPIDQRANSANVRARYVNANPEGHLTVEEVRQLPSPSPSPGSTSPSLVATEDTSSTEWTGTLSSVPFGRKHSGSLEKAIPSILNSIENAEATLGSPLPISKTLSPHELRDIPEEKIRKPRKLSGSKPGGGGEDRILKLSAAEIDELTSAPDSLPIASPRRLSASGPALLAPSPNLDRKGSSSAGLTRHLPEEHQQDEQYRKTSASEPLRVPDTNGERRVSAESAQSNGPQRRPGYASRALSATPAASNRTQSYTKGLSGQTSPKRKPITPGARPEPLDLNSISAKATFSASRGPSDDQPSPMPQSIPLPPMSIPTYLQLELSSSKPSPLYIYRPATSDGPYESSKIKFERLLNFLLLPPQLEQVLYFGTLACLDSVLYTFTILPLRFLKAAAILVQWWGEVLAKEARFIMGFIYHGAGRMWHRRRERGDSSSRSRNASRASRPSASTNPSYQSQSGRPSEAGNESSNPTNGPLSADMERKSRQRDGWGRKHRRTKSNPSSLSSSHKADLLQSAVIICSCLILMKLDASRMYHSIKGQAAIKLYVIYNMLEVADRLLSALGQDIYECLFSDETLERDLDGRSKVLRPLGMFILALIYNVIHAAALFYQVITLNVAVNSYSNALLTLLMSNQFVEIKSTVFKKFEKDNIFQLTCADVVERFQLWLMLTIIALRNIVEVGGLSILSSDSGTSEFEAPVRTNSILPNSFTILPSWSGEVLSPFLLVLGSEMLVDWIKHAYISKFNCVKPAVYQRYLDVLAKDYYTNAFVNQNLIKRLGLPVIPLSCLFIRSSVQTYHMFLATHLPPPIPSTATALSAEPAGTSPATTAALEQFDNLIRKALGRNAFGIPDPSASTHWYLPSADQFISALTMLVFFLVAFFVLLACKLVLGMLLLKFARNRYRNMKKREHLNYDTGGKRVGGWGMVEVDDAKRRYIFEDDAETLARLKEKEKVGREKAEKGSKEDFWKISRYEMSAKRIW